MEKRLVLIVALLTAFMFLPASSLATSVSYSTSGTFSGTDASGGQLLNGTATVSFAGQSSVTVNANPVTGASLGTFTVTGGSGTFSDNFSLTITQTVPAGSGSSSTTVNGSVAGTQDTIVLSFSPQTLNIGGILWTLNTSYFLVAPNTNGGRTTIQASLTPVPEPNTILLLGTGLSGLAGFFRCRFKK